ncbi:NAD(P)/FAD-dependent oxidoreductase [Mangrovimonas aestuarii]|uniref:NAD(P)/FAD-dependent oxidoreductase n=1 Tax=Mangrovimonas aestuarii TaxID=3018443 RepID=UPI0023793C47|nr:FAD-binding oxidoreductase [Mangrovimonas aestuarii]
MKQVDYIIVGCGLAGIALCDLLKRNGKSFVVFDDSSQQSSIVAGGLYNPVVLKRFTGVWKSDEQLQLLKEENQSLNKILDETFDYPVSVKRKFNSIEEQNNWFTASDKPTLASYLSTTIENNQNKAINAPFGLGVVLNTGRVDTKALITSFKAHLRQKENLIESSLAYDKVKLVQDEVHYKDFRAKSVVFCEGFGLKKNPWFNHLPLNGTKGELITIKAPNLQLDYVLKGSVFLIPMGDDLYRVGATYEWKDKTNNVTQEAREELLGKLDSLISCSYEVVDQVAGIRPTVTDRRPLVGRHEKYESLYILNGLGTRGVMIAPYIAKALFNFIENDVKLDREIDINRFTEED